jgi:flagellar protein FliO/FliZ
VSDKRLAVVETLMVGPRQRLFIVRRDNVEHLILSGPDGASVLESGIATKEMEAAGDPA